MRITDQKGCLTFRKKCVCASQICKSVLTVPIRPNCWEYFKILKLTGGNLVYFAIYTWDKEKTESLSKRNGKYGDLKRSQTGMFRILDIFKSILSILNDGSIR
jgi:hypothetical protein